MIYPLPRFPNDVTVTPVGLIRWLARLSIAEIKPKKKDRFSVPRSLSFSADEVKTKANPPLASETSTHLSLDNKS